MGLDPTLEGQPDQWVAFPDSIHEKRDRSQKIKHLQIGILPKKLIQGAPAPAQRHPSQSFALNYGRKP